MVHKTSKTLVSCIILSLERRQYLNVSYLDIGGRIYYINQLMKNVNTNVIIVAYRGFSDSDGDKPPN